MFIKSVKEYVLNNSKHIKYIELKYFYEDLDVQQTALSIVVEDLNCNAYEYLVDAIGKRILLESEKSINDTLYLCTTISPMYEESYNKVTARLGFKIK